MIDTPIALDDVRRVPGRVLASNASASLLDLDDGVVCLEFHAKGNTLDAGTLEIAEHAFAAIPRRYSGLVIGNQGRHFSFGANLRWLLSVLDDLEGDSERFRAVAKRFQRVTTGMRIAPFPVVSAPFELTVGGALELTMYADAVHAHTSMHGSLPEIAVGILPDLGGTSELYARCAEAAGAGNEATALAQAFETIVFMKASHDIGSARAMHFLREHDTETDDFEAQIAQAKARVLELTPGYRPPDHRQAIPVLGDAGFAVLEQGIEGARASGRATGYDAEIARAIARVMTGGGGPARTVSHAELLDLETDWFETLVFNPKTRARMEHMLAHGTPLRN